MQTINSTTFINVPLNKKIVISSDNLFQAVCIPVSNNYDSLVIENMLNNTPATNSYTSVNMPNVNTTCVVRPYNTHTININVSHIPINRNMIRNVYNARPDMAYPVNMMRGNGMMNNVMNNVTNSRLFGARGISNLWNSIPEWGKILVYVMIGLLVIGIVYMFYKMWYNQSSTPTKSMMNFEMENMNKPSLISQYIPKSIPTFF